MADKYVAATNFKQEDGSYIEHGESIKQGDARSKEAWEAALANKTIVTEDEYDVLFPQPNEGANQAWGTPSNLAQVEGTELQANPPEDNGESADVPEVRDAPTNPADVQPVKKKDS